MEEDILVSISILTFNHSSYIKECLDGILMQKTSFKFEILIHDDASTDGTEQIIKNYCKKYPDIIKPLYEKENQWVKGKRGSVVFNFPRAKGKYIALCEGDDYWTDPYKLQKQVDFLEKNEDFGSCFHQFIEFFQDSKSFKYESKPVLSLINSEYNGMFLDEEKYFEGWYTQILTVLFKKKLLEDIPFQKFNYFRDNHLVYYILKEKSICFNWIAAVYRKHDKGIYSGVTHKQNYIIHYFIYEELFYATKNKKFLILCNEMIYILSKSYTLIELSDFYSKIKEKSMKIKLFFSYNKKNKIKGFIKFSIYEKKYIIKEYLKRYYGKI